MMLTGSGVMVLTTLKMTNTAPTAKQMRGLSANPAG
jgi:hypothetical protein